MALFQTQPQPEVHTPHTANEVVELLEAFALSLAIESCEQREAGEVTKPIPSSPPSRKAWGIFFCPDKVLSFLFLFIFFICFYVGGRGSNQQSLEHRPKCAKRKSY